MRSPDARIAIALSIFGAAAYIAFGWGEETAYDTHGRLAAAILDGRWWLTERPPWLSDLLPCGPPDASADRWCVVYPPLPAILTIPFLPMGSTALAQVLVAQIAGGASAAPLYLGLRAFGAPRLVAVAGSLLSAFGTTLLFSSADARAPYAAHSVAMLCASVAFAFAARGGPPWAVGAAIGLATLARVPLIAVTPALALLAARASGAPVRVVMPRVILAVAPFALALLAYDALRFGSPFDTGYARLVRGDLFFSQGLFSPFYLPRQLEALLVQAPDIVEGTPWILRPQFAGMSLLITTPAFLWVFAGLRAVRRERSVAAVAAAALLGLLPALFFGSTGAPQVGYRYSIDVQPFLVALACTGDAAATGVWRRIPSILFIVACVLSLAMNVYAAIAVLRFGYWE